MAHESTLVSKPRLSTSHNSPVRSLRGSTSSLSSSTDGMSVGKKKQAPAPPGLNVVETDKVEYLRILKIII